MRNSVNQVHGHHRRPMGVARAAVSSQTSGGWAGSAVAGYACSPEWCLLGFAHGCSLARSTTSLSSLSNLSSSFPTVAVLGAAHQTATETGRTPTRSREAGSERIVHRRQLQFGEKRGSSVG